MNVTQDSLSTRLKVGSEEHTDDLLKRTNANKCSSLIYYSIDLAINTYDKENRYEE